MLQRSNHQLVVTLVGCVAICGSGNMLLQSPLSLGLPFRPLTTKKSSRLRPLEGFGSNPGNLRAWFWKPEPAAPDRLPLVVVLHGCTQDAAGFDRGSGWSKLAKTHGFAVLFPEQQRLNNANLCFSWFEPGGTRRDGGEAFSIAQMIGAMVEQHRIDRQRIFITGLSAGGAMTSVMLATYPELFAGGAILAGLPHGAAGSVPEALQQMRAHSPTPRTTGRSIKRASQHSGRWPAVSIWHGTADAVVSPSNAEAIVRQWKEVHGLSNALSTEGVVDGYPHREWRDSQGRLLVEEYRVTGMGHGTPLDTRGECGCGEAGAFMLEAGISSTVHSARTWGLLSSAKGRSKARKRVRKPASTGSRSRSGPAKAIAPPAGTTRYSELEVGIARVINIALRAAGLMK